LFSQDKGKKQLPDSLKMGKVDTTRVFRKDTTKTMKWEKGRKAVSIRSRAYSKYKKGFGSMAAKR